jgi:hypothetical protein
MIDKHTKTETQADRVADGNLIGRQDRWAAKSASRWFQEYINDLVGSGQAIGKTHPANLGSGMFGIEHCRLSASKGSDIV